MEITKDTIKHVATLSRLAFNEEELDKFTDQMGSIINMADQLSEVDTEGVGLLMHLASEKGRSVNKDLSLGICGEHGGDPSSIAFCDSLGFNYVSCSPFRVPIARLAAAQAAIRRKREN